MGSQLNHGQIRVTFLRNVAAVRLFPEGPADGREPVVLDDLTFTADGVPPLGVVRPSGLLPPRQYPLLYRVMSTQAKVRIMTESDGRLHPVEQFRVLRRSNVGEQATADRFIRAWGDRGSRARFGVMFQLVPTPPVGSLNCTSALFQVLDESVSHPNPGWRARVLDEFLPSQIPTYLEWRGYDLQRIRAPDLHVELGLPGPQQAEGGP